MIYDLVDRVQQNKMLVGLIFSVNDIGKVCYMFGMLLHGFYTVGSSKHAVLLLMTAHKLMH